MPEFGHEEYFVVKDFKSRDEAIFAARKDTNEVLHACNEFHKEHPAQRLIEKATTPTTKQSARQREHVKLVIDR
jgi:hypothetical protein